MFKDKNLQIFLKYLMVILINSLSVGVGYSSESDNIGTNVIDPLAGDILAPIVPLPPFELKTELSDKVSQFEQKIILNGMDSYSDQKVFDYFSKVLLAQGGISGGGGFNFTVSRLFCFAKDIQSQLFFTIMALPKGDYLTLRVSMVNIEAKTISEEVLWSNGSLVELSSFDLNLIDSQNVDSGTIRVFQNWDDLGAFAIYQNARAIKWDLSKYLFRCILE